MTTLKIDQIQHGVRQFPLDLIANTTTASGLKVIRQTDDTVYQFGVKVPDDIYASINLIRMDTLGDCGGSHGRRRTGFAVPSKCWSGRRGKQIFQCLIQTLRVNGLR